MPNNLGELKRSSVRHIHSLRDHLFFKVHISQPNFYALGTADKRL